MSEPEDDMSLTGIVEPPMANGEVVFEAPWQGRVFGMARALCEQRLYEWDEFRDRLIAEISTDEVRSDNRSDYQYFDHFLRAFTRLLQDKQLCELGEVDRRAEEFAARPHGHDH